MCATKRRCSCVRSWHERERANCEQKIRQGEREGVSFEVARKPSQLDRPSPAPLIRCMFFGVGVASAMPASGSASASASAPPRPLVARPGTPDDVAARGRTNATGAGAATTPARSRPPRAVDEGELDRSLQTDEREPENAGEADEDDLTARNPAHSRLAATAIRL